MLLMKRKFWFFVWLSFGLLLLSCHNGQKDTPEAATEAFTKAFYTADFTHQYQYSGKKSHVIIKNAQNGMKSNPAHLEEMKNNKVEFVSTSVDDLTDSTATCTCKVILNDQPRQDTWNLIKEEDKWKVTLVMP